MLSTISLLFIFLYKSKGYILLNKIQIVDTSLWLTHWEIQSAFSDSCSCWILNWFNHTSEVLILHQHSEKKKLSTWFLVRLNEVTLLCGALKAQFTAGGDFFSFFLPLLLLFWFMCCNSKPLPHRFTVMCAAEVVCIIHTVQILLAGRNSVITVYASPAHHITNWWTLQLQWRAAPHSQASISSWSTSATVPF